MIGVQIIFTKGVDLVIEPDYLIFYPDFSGDSP